MLRENGGVFPLMWRHTNFMRGFHPRSLRPISRDVSLRQEQLNVHQNDTLTLGAPNGPRPIAPTDTCFFFAFFNKAWELVHPLAGRSCIRLC